MHSKFSPRLENIPLACINFGERYRENYGDIAALKESIKERGLIQPIAIMDNENSTYLLLAGGRRLFACNELHKEDANLNTIACRIYPAGLNELEIRIIELAENIHREDMNYEEEAKLTREIDRLYRVLYGSKKGGWDGEGHSMQDTADLLGKDRSLVSKEISLAEAMDNVPELGKMKNKSEALKALHKIKEEVVKQEMARRVQSGEVVLDKGKKLLIDYYMIETFESGMSRIDEQSIDLIELDPPYNIELRHVVEHDEVESENLLGGKGAASEEEYRALLMTWLSVSYQKLKRDSWIILWYAMDPWHSLCLECMQKVGFEASGVHGTWSKNNGNTRTPNIRLANAYEPFLYGRKGSPTLSRQGRLNEFRYSMISDKLHPTEKPVELYADLFSTFCYPSSTIVSGFLGSGNVILGANNVGMRCFGFDMSDKYKAGFTLRVQEGIYGQYTSYR